MTDISSIFKGSRIALPSSADLRLNASTWVIDEILYDNRVDGVSEPSPDLDDQPSGWTAKYLCHDYNFPHTEAFMRVYCQAPDEGTEFQPDEDRAKQARPHFEKHEAMALKKFRQGECKSVPSLLGYSQSAQGELGPLPGGYLTHLVWEKVPGEILTPGLFWSFDRQERDFIGHIFRAAYNEMVAFGWAPGGQSVTKIIWHPESAGLCISGFHGARRTEKVWDDVVLARFRMIKPPASGFCENLKKWEW